MGSKGQVPAALIKVKRSRVCIYHRRYINIFFLKEEHLKNSKTLTLTL
jgi:hypothetical protein